MGWEPPEWSELYGGRSRESYASNEGVSASSSWPLARLESAGSLPLSRCRDRIEICEESKLLLWLKCQEAHAKPFFR